MYKDKAGRRHQENRNMKNDIMKEKKMKDKIAEDKSLKEDKFLKNEIINNIFFHNRQNRRKKFLENYLQRLYPGQNVHELYMQHQKRKQKTSMLVMAAGFLIGCMLFYMDFTNREIDEDGQIRRNGYGSSEKHIDTFVESSDYEKFELELSVPSRKYTEE